MNVVLIYGRQGSGRSTLSTSLVSSLLQITMDKTHAGKKATHRVLRVQDRIQEISTEVGWNGQKDNRGKNLLLDLEKSGMVYDRNIWVEYALSNLSQSLGFVDDFYSFIVISDFKYKSEFEYFVNTQKSIKYVIPIRITREMTSQAQPTQQELEMDASKYYILTHPNNGTIEDLDSMAQRLAVTLINHVNANNYKFSQEHWKEVLYSKGVNNV